MNDLVMQPGERVVYEMRQVVWLRSWFRRPVGRLLLTTQRLVFEVPPPIRFGASALAARELADLVPVDIPRDALLKVSRGVHRKAEVVLVVHTEHELFRFIVGGLPEWEKVLRAAIRSDQGALQAVVEKLQPKPEPPPYR